MKSLWGHVCCAGPLASKMPSSVCLVMDLLFITAITFQSEQPSMLKDAVPRSARLGWRLQRGEL